jgi:hypothetical protein
MIKFFRAFSLVLLSSTGCKDQAAMNARTPDTPEPHSVATQPSNGTIGSTPTKTQMSNSSSSQALTTLSKIPAQTVSTVSPNATRIDMNCSLQDPQCLNQTSQICKPCLAELLQRLNRNHGSYSGPQFSDSLLS